MKNIKKLTLFLAVGLTLFGPLTGLIPVGQGKASAAPNDDASPAIQLQAYIYARAMARCLIDSSNDAIDVGDDDMASIALSAFGDTDNTFVGYLDGGDDGKSDCEEAKDDPTFWIEDAASIFNFNGTSDARTFFCYAGYNSAGADSAQPASECARGTSESLSRNGSGKDAAAAFVKNVTRFYYGSESSSLPGMTPAMEYWYYYRNFVELCDPTPTGTPFEEYSADELENNPDLIYTLAQDGVTKVVYEMTDKSVSDRVTTRVTGDGASVDEVKLKCGDMAVKAREGGRAAAYAKEAGIEEGDIDENGDFNDDGNSPDVECVESEGPNPITGVVSNPLDWLTCGIVNGLRSLADGLENVIVGMLCINESDIFTSNMTCSSSEGSQSSRDSFYTAWNVFRVLALAFILIGGLIMIISQGLGFDFIDAYTIKKVLPRMLVAGIAISLSWPLLEFLVTLSNALGVGIRGLIYAPFNSIQTNSDILSGGDVALTALFTGGAFAALGALGILSFIATAVLALLIAFFVLVIRNILVIFLVIFAPLAIAFYVLPNTEKYWKLWWEWLFKALMLFPIVTAMIAVGHVFAAITLEKDSALSTFVAFAAYFAPYFLIPAAFRFAGGALATIGGFANDRSRGAFDRLSKFRSNRMERNVSAMAAGNRLRGDGAFSRGFNRTTAGVTAFATADKGLNPAKWRSAIQAHTSSHALDHAAEFSEKSSAFQSVKSNDDFLTAALKYKGNEAAISSFLKGKGYSDIAAGQGVAAIRAARRDTSDEVFETAAAMALPATGTAFRDGAGEMHEVINEVAGNDRQRAARMLASMRSGASSARRFDIAGGSYGQQLIAMEEQFAAESAFKNGASSATITDASGNKVSVTSNKQAIDVANRKVTEQSLAGQGGSYIAGSRNGAVKNFAPVMREQLDAAVASNDEIAINRELAKIAGRYDAMASVAPENAEVLANEVLSATLTSAGKNSIFSTPDGKGTSRTMTVREMIESRRGNDDFLNMRKEYGQATIGGAAQAQQAAQMAALYGQQGPNGPVQPPPAGPVIG